MLVFDFNRRSMPRFSPTAPSSVSRAVAKVPLIELASAREQADHLARRAKELRRQVKRDGVL